MISPNPEQAGKGRITLPSLILITSVLAIVVNLYLLLLSRTAIFDPLFYIPIILTAYSYPKRGVSIAGSFAVLYLIMVMVLPVGSRESALASFGHAGIFIIIGYVVSYLRIRYPTDIGARLSLWQWSDLAKLPLKKPGFILILILGSATLAVFLNFYLIFVEKTLIFDPLFYFPIIFIAYAYPQHGTGTATMFAVLFAAMVVFLGGPSSGIVAAGLGHAGIFVIIGFLVSYIVNVHTREEEIHRRLAEIVVSSSDAIIGKTLEGIITDWNKGAERLFGFPAEEVVGRPVRLLVPPGNMDDTETLLARIRNGEIIEPFETERATKDGRRIWVSLTISSIRDDAGLVIGASVIAHDITDRKLAQDALERANKKLHIFGSVTRHDVLNQLTVLNIYHNLTESMTEDPVARSFLDKAKQATEVIIRQIKFTHDYEEIGQHAPLWSDVHTGFVNAARMFKAANVSITPCREGLWIYADPLLRKVFFNLIEHSLSYGGIVSEIRCSWSEGEDGLTLLYEDNGVGVPDEDKLKIFERGTPDGTHQGLFLIREILSITNITIEENGVPGVGTRFVIRVPRGVYRINRDRKQLLA